jgi:hypothetical protein
LYRGNDCFSISATRNPAPANSIAADPPAGPVPTIATSNWFELGINLYHGFLTRASPECTG